MTRAMSMKAQTVVITRDDKPVMAAMPFELYEANMQALDVLNILLDILKDTGLMAVLHERSRKAWGSDSLVTDPCDDLLREEYLD